MKNAVFLQHVFDLADEHEKFFLKITGDIARKETKENLVKQLEFNEWNEKVFCRTQKCVENSIIHKKQSRTSEQCKSLQEFNQIEPNSKHHLLPYSKETVNFHQKDLLDSKAPISFTSGTSFEFDNEELTRSAKKEIPKLPLISLTTFDTKQPSFEPLFTTSPRFLTSRPVPNKYHSSYKRKWRRQRLGIRDSLVTSRECGSKRELVVLAANDRSPEKREKTCNFRVSGQGKVDAHGMSISTSVPKEIEQISPSSFLQIIMSPKTSASSCSTELSNSLSSHRRSCDPSSFPLPLEINSPKTSYSLRSSFQRDGLATAPSLSSRFSRTRRSFQRDTQHLPSLKSQDSLHSCLTPRASTTQSSFRSSKKPADYPQTSSASAFSPTFSSFAPSPLSIYSSPSAPVFGTRFSIDPTVWGSAQNCAFSDRSPFVASKKKDLFIPHKFEETMNWNSFDTESAEEIKRLNWPKSMKKPYFCIDNTAKIFNQDLRKKNEDLDKKGD
eukprot:MONOS_10011.1-p1 / transcript=MONOS_10011.1 / gene=MONOS_10011 / organism=Monocercomonoides_exilis_PA203 / gene_product=unspecified product / transcript_product=unspecified product / location=Mono_scaffold00437:4902-6395(-) / protein_length=498 / sequence_SO=supercontig / SO=protein_coding / is_pseudo=false